MRLTTLLVPHDGSWMADRALACATMLQRATGARLDLLRIAPNVVPGTHTQSELAPGGAVTSDRVSPVDPGADLDDPVTFIHDAIERRRPDLVVVASDSWSSAGLAVDVAHHIARRSPVPVLVVPTGMASLRGNHDVRRILVALDGSEQAEQALTPARVLADALEADLLLLRVVAPNVAVFGGPAPGDEGDLAAARRYVENLARELQTARTRVSALAVVGEPGTMIAAVSRTQRASLLAMTTRGRGALACSEMGGIATSSLQSAGMPLLLVPPFASCGWNARSPSSISKA
ncbi:MAG: universal stress protein [Chloroflexi bacterium]|nr:universal stress protein [Chloroflexota bacterium]